MVSGDGFPSFRVSEFILLRWIAAKSVGGVFTGTCGIVHFQVFAYFWNIVIEVELSISKVIFLPRSDHGSSKKLLIDRSRVKTNLSFTILTSLLVTISGSIVTNKRKICFAIENILYLERN